MTLNYTASRAVVRWAAQECEWQNSGPLSVGWMLDGWAWMRRQKKLTVRKVQVLGALVEPRANTGTDWRSINVRVGYDVKLDMKLVPDAMERLLDCALTAPEDADEWFRDYEEIHPFRDGNGRTGNILWNWLRGSLNDPQMPPNLWDDYRRNATNQGA